MSNKDPEWVNKAAVHNGVTALMLALVVQPFIVFGGLYWVLDHGTDFGDTSVITLAILAAVFDFLLLLWIIKKLKGKGGKKDNTIG